MANDFATSRVLIRLLLLLAAACGGATLPPDDPAVLDANDTGGTVAPGNESERQLLAALGQMPAGAEQRIGSMRAVADRPYHAASGRTCRRVTFGASGPQGQSRTRLACSSGKEWFFVPDVFVAPAQKP
jgi:hypothetical protein